MIFMYRSLITNIFLKIKYLGKIDKIIQLLKKEKIILRINRRGMEVKNNLMEQLIFKFPFKTKYFEHDFYVSSSNFSAYKLIESWPNWTGKWLNIFGASGMWKNSFIKNIEKKIKKVIIVNENEINDEIIKF